MVSINKYLTIVIVASVLLGAVAVAEPEEQPTTQAPAPEAAPQGPGFIGGLGNKLISGLKSAGKAVFSHVPFLNHGSSAATTASPASEETTEAAEADSAATEAASTEAPATEAAAAAEAASTEAASTEAPATEAAQAASEQPQAEEKKSE